MKIRTAFFCLATALSPAVVACPIGMQFNGNGCIPPYEHTGWDWLEDQYAAIDAIGAHRRPSPPGLSASELEELEQRALEAEQERLGKLAELAKGVWTVDSTSTPEGNLCTATFGKYTSNINDGVIGGFVTIMGFQQPNPDAWLMFQGARLPKPRNVKKLKITLQQDDEPAQTLQVFNYRETRGIGTIAFAVPGLTAMLNGMSDKQRFRLSDGGSMLLDIEWHSAAAIIEQLRQCAQ